MQSLDDFTKGLDQFSSFSPSYQKKAPTDAETKVKELSSWIKSHPTEAKKLVEDKVLLGKCLRAIDTCDHLQDQAAEFKAGLKDFTDSIIKTCIVSNLTLGPENEALVSKIRQQPDLSLEEQFASHPKDYALVLPSGEKVPVHKNLLIARCPFFERMFASGMKEATVGEAQVHLANEQQLKDFVNYLYTGQIEFTDDNFAEMFRLADMLDVSDLKKKAETFLFDAISTSEFTELEAIFKSGDDLHSNAIKQAVSNKVFADFWKSPTLDPEDPRLKFIKENGQYITKANVQSEEGFLRLLDKERSRIDQSEEIDDKWEAEIELKQKVEDLLSSIFTPLTKLEEISANLSQILPLLFDKELALNHLKSICITHHPNEFLGTYKQYEDDLFNKISQDCPNLKFLTLPRGFYRFDPDKSKLKSLEGINVTLDDDQIKKIIEDNPGLKIVNAEKVHTGSTLDAICKLKDLRILLVEGLFENDLPKLNSLPKLEILQLRDCMLSDRHKESFKKLPIHTLVLEGDSSPPGGVSALPPTLKRIYFNKEDIMATEAQRKDLRKQLQPVEVFFNVPLDLMNPPH